MLECIKNLFKSKEVAPTYPYATKYKEMPTKGFYSNGFPMGAVIHYTAGRSLDGDRNAEDVISYGISKGYCYFVISGTGKVYQPFSLDRWGQHCGMSQWNGLGATLSNKLVGIELCCAGRLNNGRTWFGEIYPEEIIRSSFHKYTPEQEKSLIELLIWLKLIRPDRFSLDYVLGHEEISPGRKEDPGNSLSMGMPEFREYLKQEYTSRILQSML